MKCRNDGTELVERSEDPEHPELTKILVCPMCAQAYDPEDGEALLPLKPFPEN